MLKSLFTLMRGRANSAVDAVIDENALTILDQQIRDCAEAVGWARKALAVAVAQNRQEQARIEKLSEQIADLEARAGLALKAGNEELATEAAEAIASLENERDAAATATSGFSRECTRLREMVRTVERRLKDLQAGRRAAKANDAVLKLRDKGLIAGESYRNTLAEAEATLARLQSRQSEIDHANDVLDELDADADPNTITQKMADAGFGAPTRKRAQDVLERLKAQQKADASAKAKSPKSDAA